MFSIIYTYKLNYFRSFGSAAHNLLIYLHVIIKVAETLIQSSHFSIWTETPKYAKLLYEACLNDVGDSSVSFFFFYQLLQNYNFSILLRFDKIELSVFFGLGIILDIVTNTFEWNLFKTIIKNNNNKIEQVWFGRTPIWVTKIYIWRVYNTNEENTAIVCKYATCDKI